MATGTAPALFILKSIDVAVAWAGAAVDEFHHRRLNPRVKLAATVKTHIGRLKVFDGKAGIGCRQRLHG